MKRIFALLMTFLVLVMAMRAISGKTEKISIYDETIGYFDEVKDDFGDSLNTYLSTMQKFVTKWKQGYYIYAVSWDEATSPGTGFNGGHKVYDYIDGVYYNYRLWNNDTWDNIASAFQTAFATPVAVLIPTCKFLGEAISELVYIIGYIPYILTA